MLTRRRTMITPLQLIGQVAADPFSAALITPHRDRIVTVILSALTQVLLFHASTGTEMPLL